MKLSNFAFFRYILYMVSGLVAYKYFGLPMVCLIALTCSMLEVVSRGLMMTYDQLRVLKEMIFLQQVSSFYNSNLELVVEQVTQEDLEAYAANPEDERAVNLFLSAARVDNESTLELPLDMKKKIAKELYSLCVMEGLEDVEEDLTEDSESDIK